MIDAVALTQALVSFDTRNPPGNEAACADYLAALLAEHGFAVERHGFGPDRYNLVAHRGDPGPAAVFTGHLDTVPLGATAWSHEPFGGEIVDGRLYGRGAADMKAGVAAMIAAAVAEAAEVGSPGVALVLTGGEETGSEGARALAATGLLPEAAFLVVAEPTANAFLLGHKGALWLEAEAQGVTAHGSTPHLGDNALVKAARGVLALDDFAFNVAPHPVMGSPTLNVSTMQAGENINSVPDRARFTIDIRTVPGLAHDHVREQVASRLGGETTLTSLIDLPAVWTAQEGTVVGNLAAAYRTATGREAAARSANYFTDASILTPALGAPTVICGPGDAVMAHKTDEYCEVVAIHEAVAIYRAMIRSLG